MGVACGGCDRFGQVKRSVSDLHWFAWERICLVALAFASLFIAFLAAVRYMLPFRSYGKKSDSFSYMSFGGTDGILCVEYRRVDSLNTPCFWFVAKKYYL